MPKFHTLKKSRKKLFDVNSSLDSAYKSLKSHIAQNNYEVVVDDKLVELSISKCGNIEVQANRPLEIPFEVYEKDESAESSLMAPKLFIPRNPVVEASFRLKKTRVESISSIKSSARNSISRASYIKKIEQEIDSIALINALNQEVNPLNSKLRIKPKKNLSFRSTKLKSGNLVGMFRSSHTKSENMHIDGRTCPSHETHTNTRPTTTSTRRSKTLLSKKLSSKKRSPSNDESIKIKISSRASNKPEDIYLTYSDTPDKISSERLNFYLQSLPPKESTESLSVRIRNHSLIDLGRSESLAGHAKAMFQARRSEHVRESITDREDYTIKGRSYSPPVDRNITTLQNSIDLFVGESFEIRPIDTSGNDLSVIPDEFNYKNTSNHSIEFLESRNKLEASSKLSDPKLETQSSQHILETRYSRSRPIVGSSTVSLKSNRFDETLKSLENVRIVYRPRYKRPSHTTQYSQVTNTSQPRYLKPTLIIPSHKSLYLDAFSISHNSRPKSGKLHGKLITGRAKSTGEVSRGRMIHNIRIDRSAVLA